MTSLTALLPDCFSPKRMNFDFHKESSSNDDGSSSIGDGESSIGGSAMSSRCSSTSEMDPNNV